MRSVILVLCLAAIGCHTVDENLGTTPDASPHPPITTKKVFGPARWAVHLGGVNDDYVEDVALDPSGDVLAVGRLAGIYPPSLQYLPYAGFITKRAAADGAELWRVNLTNSEPAGTSDVRQLAVDLDGNVIVIGGHTGGSVDLGGQTLSCAPIADCYQAFIAKYDRLGTLLWARVFDPAMKGDFSTLALGADGTIYLAGTFLGTFDLGNGPITTSAGDGLLVAYDQAGAIEWGTVFEGGSFYGAGAATIAVANDGDVAVAGTFRGRLAVAGQVWQLDELEPREFVARFSSTGVFRWARWLGPGTEGSEVFPVALAFDAAGRTVDFGSEQDGGVSSLARATLHELDVGGSDVWTERSVSGGTESGALALLPDGTIAVGGYINNSTADFGTGKLTAPSGMEISNSMYLAAYDDHGACEDAIAFPWIGGTYSADDVTSLRPTATGGFAFGGTFDQTVDFGGIELVGNGKTDGVIVMLDPPAP